jgi:pyrophosphate--fructose-6-phosphate 1-phosphotransferase
VKLDLVNPGQWFAEQFAEKVGAEKTMVQKSGYFSRSAPANEADRTLIRQMVEVAVEAAQSGIAGVVGQDEEREDELRTIEFERIAGGKAFDTSVDWFQTVLKRSGQA